MDIWNKIAWEMVMQYGCVDVLFHMFEHASKSSEASLAFHRQSSFTREIFASISPWLSHWTNICLQGDGSPWGWCFSWCGGMFTLCFQGETPGGLGLSCHCRLSVAACAERPLLFQICLQQSNLGLSVSQSCQIEASSATVCPWALTKQQQQSRET